MEDDLEADNRGEYMLGGLLFFICGYIAGAASVVAFLFLF